MNTLVTVDLKQYWFILRRRWQPAVAIFGAIVGLTGLSLALQKPEYEAAGKLLLSDSRIPSLTGLDEGGSLKALTEDGNPADTQAEVIQSDPVALKTITILNLTDQEGSLMDPEEFLENLSVKNVPGTDVLQLTYTDTNPDQAAAVVNALMDFYLLNSVTTNRTQATAARMFLERQSPVVEGNVQKAETALRKFEETNNVADLQEQTTSKVKMIGNLEDQVAQAQAELAETNSQSSGLRRQVGVNLWQAKAANALSQSLAVQEALRELQQAEGQLAIARTQYQEAHPIVVNLKNRAGTLKAFLQSRVKQVVGEQVQQPKGNLQTGDTQQKLTEEFIDSEVKRSSLTSKVTALSNQLSAYQRQANLLPRLKQIQRGLERRLAVSQVTYQTLSKQLQEARLAENQKLGNAQVLQAARIPEDSTSSTTMLLIIGGLLGSILGIATAFILEALDTSVNTVEKARDLLNYNLLGIIPYLESSAEVSHTVLKQVTPLMLVRDTSQFTNNEAYRILQANLKLISFDRPLKAIVVTSSVPQEGRSTISASLALTMAQLNNRVLLVDADMRHSAQHQIWQLSNTVGLSDILTEQALYRTAIQQETTNLDVLTSGVSHPNPTALLDSKNMTLLIKDLSKHYDYVIIDTPPLATASDALILGKMADGMLMIARPGVVDSSSAASVKEALAQSSQNVLGLVINGIILDNKFNSHYFYCTKSVA